MKEVEKGVYEMADLPIGAYFVVETKTPEGFLRDTSAHYAEITKAGETVVVYNDPYISELVLESARRAVGEDNIVQMPQKMSSEDFSHYLSKKPGVFFRLGTRNEKKGCTTLPHNDNFMIDEDAFESGCNTCVQFVLDNMNGIHYK